MPDAPSFERFRDELARLVEQFGRNIAHYKSGAYDEASLRQEFLNPLFRVLGWDVENRAGLIPQHREVEIESRTEVAGRQKRADYLFRTERRDRFVCEAKKPAEALHARYAFQAKRYAWNKGLVLAVLTDFEETLVYVVGARPHPEEAGAGLWKTWRFQEYPAVAQEMWDLLARPRVAEGGIERLVEQLPRRPAGKGRARQRWLFKPDRSRALDADFLSFLDGARRELASDLIRHNERTDLLEGDRLNEAVQRILDRLLFLRICEDRDIDTGRPLALILQSWRGSVDNPVPRRPGQSELIVSEEMVAYRTPRRPGQRSLWRDVVAHFRSLDRRPPSYIPFFNGNLFKPHFSEDLEVSDEWIADFLDDVGDEKSPYLFNVIPVEILGTIYERFLGKVVRRSGRGVTIEEKPEVRKAGGVYYTPRYIVDYIVEQTVGKLLDDLTPQASLELRVLDPACGSGSFLIRAFERLCEHWQAAMTRDRRARRREDCWTDRETGDVHLTTDLKRRILTANIYGVDIDPGAVEVTQLSLYLKMLEGENRATLERERNLFGGDVALLPPLEANIKCGNSLIASDFSLLPEDLVRVRAFDWDVQFPGVMRAGGFDAVISNPPYGRVLEDQTEKYVMQRSGVFSASPDVYVAFVERGIEVSRSGGRVSYIVPSAWLGGPRYKALRVRMLEFGVDRIVALPFDVFADAYIDTAVFVLVKEQPADGHRVRCFAYPKKAKMEAICLGERDYSTVPITVWKQSPDKKFVLSVRVANLVRRLLHTIPTRIGDFADMKRGVLFAPDLLTRRKTGKDSHRYFQGDVYRYDLAFSAPNWVEYGPSMREWPKEFRWFQGPRLLMRRLVNRQRRLMTAPAKRTFITNKNLYSLLGRDDVCLGEQGIWFLLGVLNSRLLSFVYLSQVQQATKDDFPQVTIADVLALPCPTPSGDVLKRIAELAKKASALAPRLRAAKTDRKRAALQNAVSATDRRIDALVYELYGLTPDEVRLVEGGA